MNITRIAKTSIYRVVATVLFVSSTAWAQLPVSVDNVPHVIVDTAPSTAVTGPLTDAQLRDSAVLVTANAGTNLNTSALALETGGNLATVVTNTGATATAVQIIDDWDESDRAKVNPIAGQAGVQGGAGTVSALTQRVVLATDQGALTVVQPAFGAGATGSAVPANAVYHAGRGASSLVGYLNCDNTAVYDASTNGSTELVALTSSAVIHVCGFQISTSSSSAVSVNLRYGTGSACATSPQNITPAYPLQAAASTGPIGMVVMTPGFTGLKTAASNALCINTNAAVSVQALVWYAKFVP